MGRNSNALNEAIDYSSRNLTLVRQEQQVGLNTKRDLGHLIVACRDSFADGVITVGEKRLIAARLSRVCIGVEAGLDLDRKDETNATGLDDLIALLK